jgi:hypothetical protein
MDVGDWLRSLRLSRYEGVFREAEIGPDVLLDLTDSDAFQLAGAPEAGLSPDGDRSAAAPAATRSHAS